MLSVNPVTAPHSGILIHRQVPPPVMPVASGQLTGAPTPAPSVVQLVLLVDGAPAARLAVDGILPALFDTLRVFVRLRRQQYQQMLQQQQQLLHIPNPQQSQLEVEWSAISFGGSQLHSAAWVKMDREIEAFLKKPEASVSATGSQSGSAVSMLPGVSPSPIPATGHIWWNSHILDGICAVKSLFGLSFMPGVSYERHVILVTGTVSASSDQCGFCLQPHSIIEAVQSLKKASFEGSSSGDLSIIPLNAAANPSYHHSVWGHILNASGCASSMVDPPLTSGVSTPQAQLQEVLCKMRGSLAHSIFQLVSSTQISQPSISVAPNAMPAQPPGPRPVSSTGSLVVNKPSNAANLQNTAPAGAAATTASSSASRPLWTGSLVVPGSRTFSIMASYFPTQQHRSITSVNWPPTLSPTPHSAKQVQLLLNGTNLNNRPAFQLFPTNSSDPTVQNAWGQFIKVLSEQSTWLIADLPPLSISIWIKPSKGSLFAFQSVALPAQQFQPALAAQAPATSIQHVPTPTNVHTHVPQTQPRFVLSQSGNTLMPSAPQTSAPQTPTPAASVRIVYNPPSVSSSNTSSVKGPTHASLQQNLYHSGAPHPR